MKNGIDISRWNGDIDIRSTGADFAIIKAGGSDDGIYTDSQFLNNYIKCKNAGIPCGIYWYTQAVTVTNLQTEIKYLLGEINGLQFELPIFLDLEEAVIYQKAGQLAADWLNELPQHGCYPGIYSSYSWYFDTLKNVSCDPIQKWIALWGESDPGMSCGIWQTGAVDNIDRDIMYADYSFIKEKGLNGFSKKVYFSDVTTDMAYYNAVMEAASDGLVKGFPDGTFRPEEPVTRGQLCIILKRLREHDGC